MDDIYRDLIIDRYQNPKNRGKIKGIERNKFEDKFKRSCNVNPRKTGLYVAEEANLLCGDKLLISAEIKNGVIAEIKFDGGGCAISMAAVDLLLDKIKGKKLSEIKKMSGKEIEEMMGVELTPARKKCAYLGLEVVKKLVE